MQVKILLLGATMLLLSACGGLPPSNPQVDTSPTSYRSGYGVRNYAIGGVSDSHLDWGE